MSAAARSASSVRLKMVGPEPVRRGSPPARLTAASRPSSSGRRRRAGASRSFSARPHSSGRSSAKTAAVDRPNGRMHQHHVARLGRQRLDHARRCRSTRAAGAHDGEERDVRADARQRRRASAASRPRAARARRARGARPPRRPTSRRPGRRQPESASRGPGRPAPAPRRGRHAGRATPGSPARAAAVGALTLDPQPAAARHEQEPIGQLQQHDDRRRAGACHRRDAPRREGEVELGRCLERAARRSQRAAPSRPVRQAHSSTRQGLRSPLRIDATGRERLGDPSRSRAAPAPAPLWTCLRRCRNPACTTR